MASSGARYLSRKLLLNAVMVAAVLIVCPWLLQGVRDSYVGYSGIVVAKGDYMWVPFRGVDWYIILEDSQGRRTKRYVSAYGYAYCDIGSYVVKKRVFGEYPRKPVDLTPHEVEQLVRRKREQK
jgi:hypothetical protein